MGWSCWDRLCQLSKGEGNASPTQGVVQIEVHEKGVWSQESRGSERGTSSSGKARTEALAYKLSRS